MSHPTPSLFSQTLPGLPPPALRASCHSIWPQPLSCPSARPPPSVRLITSLLHVWWLRISLRTCTQLPQEQSYSSLGTVLFPCSCNGGHYPLLWWNPQWLPSAYPHGPPRSQGVPASGPNLPFLLTSYRFPLRQETALQALNMLWVFHLPDFSHALLSPWNALCPPILTNQNTPKSNSAPLSLENLTMPPPQMLYLRSLEVIDTLLLSFCIMVLIFL